ncbi:hypothetical protein [Streptomyces sp. NPDC101237]|uniref:hypothetical protein n=1 Tax=Streptomyces sp. NPDC101237 TaxID=3366139 RepID=UPI0037F723D5
MCQEKRARCTALRGPLAGRALRVGQGAGHVDGGRGRGSPPPGRPGTHGERAAESAGVLDGFNGRNLSRAGREAAGAV